MESYPNSRYNVQGNQPTVPPPSYDSTVDTPSTNKQTDYSEEETFGSSFSERAIRHAFIRKVYLILMTQLLVTFGFICVFSLVQPVKDYVRGDGSWVYWVSYGTFLVTYIVLVCIPSVRMKYPGNFICLGIFTLAFSYVVGTISSYYDTTIVFVAAGVTCLVCLSISLFAIQTKIDFTMCSGLLFCLVMVLFFFGWSCLVFYFVFPASMFSLRIMDCLYGGLAALVFSLFLVYDTQMVMGGRKHELSPEDYVSGALQLYIDVVYLFLILLACFGKGNG